mmetsp:Transcript_86549/g.181279  ORF Transcript_86549/g.181279 Transcript_86549/m.181279 type:complete len:222 (+) Transcript_86549:490-1155(+)
MRRSCSQPQPRPNFSRRLLRSAPQLDLPSPRPSTTSQKRKRRPCRQPHTKQTQVRSATRERQKPSQQLPLQSLEGPQPHCPSQGFSQPGWLQAPKSLRSASMVQELPCPQTYTAALLPLLPSTIGRTHCPSPTSACGAFCSSRDLSYQEPKSPHTPSPPVTNERSMATTTWAMVVTMTMMLRTCHSSTSQTSQICHFPMRASETCLAQRRGRTHAQTMTVT